MSFGLQREDLVVLDEIVAAVRGLSATERQALKDEIATDGKILDPLLWYRSSHGECVMVDGHHRDMICDELQEANADFPEPELLEVESLRGAVTEDVVEWVRRHQASRRNDESLQKVYQVGKAYLQGSASSTELATEFGMTSSQVRHAGTVAAKVDEAEEFEPGSKDAILASNLTPNAIRTAPTPSSIVESAKSGASRIRESHASPAESFKPITTAIGALSRAVNKKVNETTSNSWSDKIAELINEISGQVGEWTASEVL